MTRLSQPTDPSNSRLEAAYEMLKVHASKRIEVRNHDGHLTQLFYNSGIPIKEIAQHYGVAERTVYDILKRQEATQ